MSLKGNPKSIDQESLSPMPDMFDVARKIEALLAPLSNRTVRETLELVAVRQHLRVIPIDRPIGQYRSGTTKVVPLLKARKGVPTPPAPWKQTDDYHRLSAERLELVKQLKTLVNPTGAAIAAKEGLITRLREVEGSIRDLRSPKSGNY